ncbi:C4-dicarboxylate ABC transporter permease [Zobellella taiwanensis]|uniref:TRAP transporter large permease protein n=1 Tax=Zobellella taiwanensis TaxID=347535 RepID=A0A2P7QL48_9GAMM|nr:TRAP transporter large permease [Zobellella taiwanensis]PSJ38670.1 C4-dicarboxylate ABC transporter permease [Zobellella taiwanensis]
MITSVIFFITLLLGLPIFITLLLGTLVFLWQTDLTVLMSSLPIQLYGSLNQNGLLAIPLFMLVGELMNKGGLTSRLMNAADVFVGGFKGGLAYVNLLTNAMAASILGSATAQIAVMSRLMIPTMVEKGYKKEFSAAVTMAGGLLGPIIPPSMLMIIYGVVAYQPISALFIAGILPGLLIIAGFALVIFLTGLFAGLPSGEHLKHKNIRQELVNGLLPGTIPVVVIVCIISGVMTPTEAGAIASILAFVIGAVVYKSINLKELPGIFASVALNTATITGLIATASVFGWALSFEAVPDMLVEWISGITTSPLLFLMLVYVLVILLGMFLESISVMIVIVPIILPAAVSFGIDPIHFGVIISLATLIGLVTPPVGPGLYIAMTSANLPMGALFKAMIPFLASMLVCMLIIAVFPAISLWLPSLM